MTTLRVLIPHGISENLYVEEIAAAYRRLGCTVVCDPNAFWADGDAQDVVHLHWPEELYRWRTVETPDVALIRLVDRLDAITAKGGSIVWTIHNLVPHEHSDEDVDRRAYQEVATRADVLVHHCPASRHLLAERYALRPGAVHVVSPHGNYFGYPKGGGRDEARRALGLAADEFVYLLFGAIRGYKGIDFVLDAFARVKVKRKRLVVAGRYQSIGGSRTLKERIDVWRLRYLTPGVKASLGVVAKEDLHFFLEACDAVVMGHSRGLNSGLVPLGMSFGRPVIGPAIGCIDWCLGQGTNLSYTANDLSDFVRKMEAAATLDINAVAVRNIAVAQEWTWDDGVKKIVGAIGRRGLDGA